MSSPSPSFGTLILATRAASARRGEIPRAMSAGVVPLGTSFTLPSGSVTCICSMISFTWKEKRNHYRTPSVSLDGTPTSYRPPAAHRYGSSDLNFKFGTDKTATTRSHSSLRCPHEGFPPLPAPHAHLVRPLRAPKS